MKETKFIAHNKEKWVRFEELYQSKSNDPEELSDLYLDITDDLSYSQTFYSRRTVRVYLNELAQRVYLGVHQQKGESLSKFISVWKTSLPLEIYRSRKTLFFALIAFIVYLMIGVITTHSDPDFPRIVMGDAYVDMTIENIQKGNPLAVYESDRQMDMFLMITSNNLKVAFLTFVLGFFFTIGTHVLLFYNGVMLGAFQYFFHLKGLLISSFLGIWIHGAFEISAIVLAGGAGITAGNGFLFPKSYTRLQSLQLSTKRGLKIMLSLVPFIIIAGLLESYVTHNYQVLPDWSKWTLILLSFSLILGLYVLYPIYVARKNPELVEREDVSGFQVKKEIVFYKIRSAGEVLADSFKLYRKIFFKAMKPVVSVVLPLSLLLIYLQFVNHFDSQKTQYWFDWSSQFEMQFGYGFKNFQDGISLLGWICLLVVVTASFFYQTKLLAESGEPSFTSFWSFVAKRAISLFGALLPIVLLATLLPWYLLLMAIFFLPFFWVLPATVALDDHSFWKRFRKGLRYSRSYYGNALLVLLVLLSFTAIVMQPIASVFSLHTEWSDEPNMRDLLDFAADFIKRIASIYTGEGIPWANLFRQVVYFTFILFVLPLFFMSMVLAYYGEKERHELTDLRRQFEKFGKGSRSQEKDSDFE